MKKLFITLFVGLTAICTYARSESFSWSLVNAADSGDTNAQYSLAECYFYGNGTSPDIDKAIRYYEKASRKVRGARFKYLALLLLKSLGTSDWESVEDCLETLGNKSVIDDPGCSFFLAKFYNNLYGETDKAAVYLKELANKQDLPDYIKNEVSHMSRNRGVSQVYSTEKAAKWLGLDGVMPEYMYQVMPILLLPQGETYLPEEDLANTPQITFIEIVPDHEAAIGVTDLTESMVHNEVIVEPYIDNTPRDIVYSTDNVQQQPMFPGGEAAMFKWLSENIEYPNSAKEEGVQGRVVVEFIISESGAITNARVIRGRYPSLDKEALRLVNKMPKWEPGRVNGQTVKVRYNLPITFRLPAD